MKWLLLGALVALLVNGVRYEIHQQELYAKYHTH